MNISFNNRVNFKAGYIENKEAANVLKSQPFARQFEIVDALNHAKDSKYYDLCYRKDNRLYIIDSENNLEYDKVSSFADIGCIVKTKPYNSDKEVSIPLMFEEYKTLKSDTNMINFFNALEATKANYKPVFDQIDELVK